MITDDDLRLYDMLTFTYQNLVFLTDLNTHLINDAKDQKQGPVSQYYYEWCTKRIPEKKQPLPVNPGTIWMITSAIIINCASRWLKYLPKTRISKSGEEWGLIQSRLTFPEDPDPSIKRVTRKIRNAIAHTRFSFHVVNVNVPWTTLINESTYTFWDKDDFTLEISMLNLTKLIGSIYLEIGKKMKEYKRTR